jgi:hypothetical protein
MLESLHYPFSIQYNPRIPFVPLLWFFSVMFPSFLLSVVWLPIALTCRICHDTQYRDTYRTLKYHYLLKLLHWTHLPNALSIPTLSMPHISISVIACNTEMATGHRCMVAHCSDMQDPSRHTILRQLQDTEVPLYPRHYSYSSNYYTGLIIPMLYQCRCYQGRIYPSLSRHAISRRLQHTALPLHLAITPLSLSSSCRTHQYQYRWPRYHIYAPIPQHRTRSLTTPGPRIQYRLPCYGYIGTLLYLHRSASASAVSHGYYKQMRPTGLDPDPTPTLFLAALVAQPSAM